MPLLFVAALTSVLVCILGVAKPANAAGFCDPECLLTRAQALRQEAGHQIAEFPGTVRADATSLAALGHFDNAVKLARTIEPLEWRASALSRIALAQALSGDYDGAVVLFAEAVDDLKDIKADTFVSRPLFALVADMARSGDLPAARMAAIRLTQDRLPWMRPAALATIAFAAEQAGLSATALWEDASSSTKLSINPDWRREPDWNLLAMEMVGRRAAAAGHPDLALALADKADELIADLPPQSGVIDWVPRRETTPGKLRMAAIVAMARQGDCEAAMRELDRNGTGGFSKLDATFGEALAAVARRIQASTAQDRNALADAVRRATENVAGAPERQVSWLADIAPAFGRLGDKADQTAVFHRIEQLVPTIIGYRTVNAFRLKVSALVYLAVARHRAGQTSEVDATFERAEAMLDNIATRDELRLARWLLVTGLAATNRGAAAWALSNRFQAAGPAENHQLRYSAFRIALDEDNEEQALWMIDHADSGEEKDGFLASYSGMLAEKGLFVEAQASADAIGNPRSKAGALTELAQAMINTRGGKLHPTWVQWPGPEEPYAVHLSVEAYWPLFRDTPFDPTLDY